jgi:AcrR family transcriptional regulator
MFSTRILLLRDGLENTVADVVNACYRAEMRANTHVQESLLEPRRRPQQIRSRRRVEKILQAATDIFAEVGFEHATTNAIAERASVSIGSLYQFFPNKAAILSALNDRCLTELRDVLDSASDGAFTAGTETLSANDLIDGIVDALAEFQRRIGTLVGVFTSLRSSEFSRTEDSLNLEISRRVEWLLAQHFPHVPLERRAVVASVAVSTTDAVFCLVAVSDEATQERLVAEVRTMLKAYIGTLGLPA